ncbi:MAG: DUF1489 domain-containing protein [Azospirillaceae bacterium]|nr:DUF1489 domain-containing protein [Azospirillaceae bacterium]
MPIHLIRLAVGVESVAHLTALFQPRRVPRGGRDVVWTVTRRTPRRADELCDGGSLYWVIKGVVEIRQPVIAIEAVTEDDGQAACRLVLGADLVATQPMPRRPFQGWRYLAPADAPIDILTDGGHDDLSGARAGDLLRELRSLGLA